MKINDTYINRFLLGKLPTGEEQEVRAAMADDEDLTAQIARRKLEMMVVEELDRQYWGKMVQGHERSFRKRSAARRMVTYAAAAAIAAIVFFTVVLPFGTPRYSGPVAFNTDYNTNLKGLSAFSEFPVEMLRGKWSATITEQPGLELNLEIDLRPDDQFALSVFYTINNEKKEGDKITARGTYSLSGNLLVLHLDEASIKRAPGASPFHTAPIELWLKTARPFTQQVEIADLNNRYLILKYGLGQGLEWKKE